jgi:hypothetical protein
MLFDSYSHSAADASADCGADVSADTCTDSRADVRADSSPDSRADVRADSSPDRFPNRCPNVSAHDITAIFLADNASSRRVPQRRRCGLRADLFGLVNVQCLRSMRRRDYSWCGTNDTGAINASASADNRGAVGSCCSMPQCVPGTGGFWGELLSSKAL